MKVNESNFLEERQAHIFNLINEYRRVTVQELSKYFKISAVTIRNDLNALEQAGKIIRTHGGAIAVDETPSDPSFDNRHAKNKDIKKEIGRIAADLIQDGELVFIDGGTTCSNMYPYLTNKNDLTVITPSIETAYWLTKTSSVNIHLLGGDIRRETLSTVSKYREGSYSNLNISKAFISAYSFTPEDGIMEVFQVEDDQRVHILQHARQIIALIDSSKWGKLSMATVLRTDKIRTMVTDANVPSDLREKVENQGIEVITV